MNEELGQRAIACKGWRWLPGMRATIPDAPGNARIVSIDEVAIKGGFSDVRWDHDSWTYGHPRPWLPDLSDPATLGCLLALVRSAWGEDCWLSPGEPDEWFAWSISSNIERRAIGWGDGRAEALVAALEAAP